MSISLLKQKGIGLLLLSFFSLGLLPSGALAQSVCNSMDFTDVTLSSGITHQYFLPSGSTSSPIQPNHGGAVAEDFNGDGWLDLYVVQGAGGPNLLYINDQLGGFIDEAAARSADIQAASVAASAADFDNDGDIDIAVSIVGDQSRVLVNDGNGNFTSEIVLSNTLNSTTSTSWGDVDNDGLLELAIGQREFNIQSFFLYKNEGGTTLTEYEFRNVPRSDTLVFAPRFADFNGDRLADLHIVSDSAQSQLYMNAGGGMFDNVTNTNGTGVGQSEMGHAIGDYDSDGDLDLFTSNIFNTGGNRLYVNDGSGVFSEVQDAAGAADGAWGWGASFGDLDNDGNLDIYHVNGWHTSSVNIDTPARLFLNQGDNTFVDEASCANAGDTGQGKGMLQFDYDNDGDLDIFIVNSMDLTVVGEEFPGTPVLLRNDTANGNHWLKVTLDAQPPLHRNGIGSRVLVRTGADTRMHEMNASTNFLSQNPSSIAHFGLGLELSADEVIAEWVNGDTTSLFNVAADQQISLTSPVATVSAREIALNEIVTADASAVSDPVEWVIDGVVYADPVAISFDTEGVRDFTLNVYDSTQTIIVRREILPVSVSTDAVTPEVTSPIDGSTLSGETETFDWTDNGESVTDWQLLIGTSVGDSSIYDSGVLTPTVLSDTVSGLPIDGSTVFVRLLYTFEGITSSIDYSYTAFESTVIIGDPEISNPAPGSVLSGSTVTFDFGDNGSGATIWRLLLGTAPGASDLGDSGILDASVLSTTFSGLPTDGSTVNATLFWRVEDGVPASQLAFTYTASSVVVVGDPDVTSPAPGSTLSGDTETFNWADNASGASDWQLLVGTSVGDSSIFDSGVLTSDVLSQVVSGLPIDGSTVFVRLEYTISGINDLVDYTYTSSNPSAVPEITNPAPGSILSGESVTFDFADNGVGATLWRLLLGTEPGASNLADSGIVDASVLSTTLSGLPTDGSTVNATLMWRADGDSGPANQLAFTYIAGEEVEDVQDPSVAHQWSEVLLDGIRGDFARPTMHSRNLWHISAAMYDAWAIYDDVSSTYLLGRTVSGFACDLNDTMTTVDLQLDREEALSYAAYGLINYRYVDSPGAVDTLAAADDLMASLGYDITNTSTDTSGNSPAALGNLIAQCYINFGLQDGSNEANGFANTTYEPVNPDIDPNNPGNPGIIDLDRWQPISLPLFIDQSGNPVYGESIFLSPEWGQVTPFSLTDDDKTTYERDGFEYQVYHDPGAPPSAFGDAEYYQWGFSLVSIWSSHLDPADGVMIDISPASFGNIQYYPTDWAEYPAFYDQLQGGDPSVGYTVNPVTGLPYEPQMVPRADYARVLAEFWADGPESETPPGHWYTIVNTIGQHPDMVKQIGGEGDIVGPLEWDIKVYFLLGGAMHDSAITAWGMKGWYDYLRPVSAIRAMADLGQSSDPGADFYSEQGMPLTPGYVEMVESGDPLAGDADEHVGKIKVYAWRGPDYIEDPDTDIAGVGWILAENWWPYQRPTFVTPPFAGYVSGHSVFSRAAAEVLTSYTGSPYFPGGMSDFQAPQNEFLVFEDGPSVDITLQWATYRDASDQTSLSRIWGGIHPPVDDLPGRAIGAAIAEDAYSLASGYFNGTN